MLHEILEEVYPAAEDPANVESVLDELERVAEPIMEQAPAKRGFRPTPLWEIEREQYAEALRETVRELAEEGTGWTPDEFELRFGIGENAPLELDTGSSIVKVRGIVDRLDRREDGGLRVIDYKTYGGQLNAGELDEGRRIQLPLYALAAQDALKLGEVVEGFYWKILAAKRGPLRLSNYRAQNEEGAAGPEVAYATVRKHVGRIVEGVASGHFEPEPPPGGCPSYCPAATYCWRYQPRAGGR